MEGDRVGTRGNVWDVSISFPESPMQHIQVQSSADDDGDDKEELTGLNICLEIDAMRLECLELQDMLAFFAADFKVDFSFAQLVLSQMSCRAHNERADMDVRKEMLENRKKFLEHCLRFHGRRRESETVNFNFLKEERELMLVVEELKSESKNSTISLMNKEIEINALTEALNKCKEEFEAVAKEKEAVLSLEAKLIVMRDMVDELIAERQKKGFAMVKKDEVIASLTKELRIKREKGINLLELKKTFGAATTKKEDEIMPLKKDLILANENQEFENVLEGKLKPLKGNMSNLEEMIKKLV